MGCSRAQNQISAYLDRELTGEEMLEIRQHLRACPECATEHSAILRVKRLLSGLPVHDPAQAFSASLLNRTSSGRYPWGRRLRLALGALF